MEDIIKFTVGSKAFFSSFDDFNPKDSDYLIITDNPPKGKKCQILKFSKNREYFVYKKMPKNEFIDSCIHSKLPMCIGMLLSPEVANYIGMTIDDLELLQNVIYHIDEKHSYEKLIYDYYIQNNGFYLTDEQLKAVYEEYKSKRPKFYSVE